MTKGDVTRAKIVSEALSQSVIIGLEGVSLGPLAEQLGLSKSGLYAHFKSKEALQVAVLEEAIERFKRAVVIPGLRRPAGRARLRVLFTKYLDWISGDHEAGGCPFTVFVQEYDDRPGVLREMLSASQREWRELLGRSVSEAVRSKEIRSDLEPAQTAFELVGIALSYQMAQRLLGEKGARRRAMTAFERLID